MVKVSTKLIFELSPEMRAEFDKEAERLNIALVELFRRMWELWQKKVKK